MSHGGAAAVFTRPAPPWFALSAEAPAREAVALEPALRGDVALVGLDGAAMADHDSLMAEFQRAFAIPRYFGHNWNALSEVLSDLEWFPAWGYLAHVRGAETLLSQDDPAELTTFLDVAQGVCLEWARAVRTGEYWDRPPRPFHWLLSCSDDARPRLLRAFADTGTGPPLLL